MIKKILTGAVMAIMIAAGAENPEILPLQMIVSGDWGDSNVGVGTEPGLKLHLRNISPDPIAFKLDWRLHDFVGKELSGANSEIKLAGLARQDLPLPVKLPGLGWYRIDIAIDAAKPPTHLKQSFSLASVPKVENNGYDRSSPFGTNGHNELNYALLRSLGVTMSRVDVEWRLMEPQEGQWDWEPIERLLPESKANGVLLFGCIGYNPPWLKVPEGKGTDHEKFLNFIRKTVTHFKDSIFYWDLWNEPQYSWSGGKEEFGQLMYRAYRIIKEIQPESTVCFNAHPFENTMQGYTLDNLKPLKGKLPFDVLGVHPYSRPKSPDDIDFYYHMIEMHKWVKNNAPDRQLWISELGWETSTDALGVSERLQAAYLVRSAVMGLAAGVKKYIWYQPYSGRDMTYGEAQYGFLDADLQPKPSAAAYAWTAFLLREATFLEEIKLGRSLRCFAFSRPNKEAVAYLWAVNDPLILHLPGKLPADMSVTRIDGSDMPAQGNILQAEDIATVIRLPQKKLSELKALLRESKLSMDNPVRVKSVIPDNDSIRLIMENRDIKEIAVSLNVILPPGMKFQNSKLNGQSPAKIDFSIPGSEKEIRLKVKYPHLPLNDQLAIAINTSAGQKKLMLPIHVETAHYMPSFALNGNLDKWRKFTPIILNDFNHIGPADMQKDWKGPSDLSVKAWFGWNEQGLLLAAEVSDDKHCNSSDANNLWGEDSIQIAIDLSSKIIPNSYGSTSAEVGVGLSTKGTLSAVYSGNAAIMPQTVIRRNGNHTDYEILLPWTVCGTNNPTPSAGTFISAGFIVNDSDGAARKWMGLRQNIIGQDKNPSMLPRLLLEKPQQK